jgi:hypothetical protein
MCSIGFLIFKDVCIIFVFVLLAVAVRAMKGTSGRRFFKDPMLAYIGWNPSADQERILCASSTNASEGGLLDDQLP